MRIVRTKAELREALAPAAPRAGARSASCRRWAPCTTATCRCCAAARERCDVVVMSLFVNPTQFGPGEDLEAYPRDEARDLELADRRGVDLVYAPAADEVYPAGVRDLGRGRRRLTAVLDGDPERRGAEHFRGVTTVVAKLFNSVGPDLAFFGQKDAQQAVVIRRMVRDLDFPVEIVVLPTVREPDGLAMSSRNAYLKPTSASGRRR